MASEELDSAKTALMTMSRTRHGRRALDMASKFLEFVAGPAADDEKRRHQIDVGYAYDQILYRPWEHLPDYLDAVAANLDLVTDLLSTPALVGQVR